MLALVAALTAGGYVAFKLIDGKESLNRITSDRTERVQDTLAVIEADPLLGVGIGGQPRASRRLAESDQPTPAFVSHTTPLTVAAKLGPVGVCSTRAVVRRAALIASSSVRRSDRAGARCQLSRAFVRAVLQRFLEDPITWAGARRRGGLAQLAGGASAGR